MRKVLSFAALTVAWLLLAVTAVAIWLHYASSRGTVALYATAAVPFTVITGALAFMVFLALRRWFAVALSVLAVAGLCVTQFPLWVGETPTAGARFTVISANLQLGAADIDDLARITAAADLVALTEVTPEASERIRTSALTQRFPHQYSVPIRLSAGTMLLSRTDLTDRQRVPNMIAANLSAQTSVPGATAVRVLAVHPAAPLTGHSGEWARDMQVLHSHLDALPAGPVIVAGDFNATWDHSQFRKLLDNGFADAAVQAGAGWLPTYPTDRIGDRPLVGIDHVVVRGFTAAQVRTESLAGSDHRALIVSLVATST